MSNQNKVVGARSPLIQSKRHAGDENVQNSPHAGVDVSDEEDVHFPDEPDSVRPQYEVDNCKNWFAALKPRAAATHIGFGAVMSGVAVGGAVLGLWYQYMHKSESDQQFIAGCNASLSRATIENYPQVIQECSTGPGYAALGYAAKQFIDYMLQGAQLAYNSWASNGK
jgi:hypothetical protein